MKELIKLAEKCGYNFDADPSDKLEEYINLYLIQHWLREEKNINITIITDYKIMKVYKVGVIYVEDNKVESHFIKSSNNFLIKDFDIYEEALKEGIKKSIATIMKEIKLEELSIADLVALTQYNPHWLDELMKDAIKIEMYKRISQIQFTK